MLFVIVLNWNYFQLFDKPMDCYLYFPFLISKLFLHRLIYLSFSKHILWYIIHKIIQYEAEAGSLDKNKKTIITYYWGLDLSTKIPFAFWSHFPRQPVLGFLLLIDDKESFWNFFAVNYFCEARNTMKPRISIVR